MKYSIFSLFLLWSVIGSAQQSGIKLSGLNHQVQYVNETVHGILITHRLMQDFNQQINKYADLEGYPIQNFGNEYLPADIMDTEAFFDPTPEVIFTEVRKANINADLNSLIAKLRNICKAMNRIRFEVDEYIEAHDLSQPEQLQGVYDRLEKAVKFYDDYFATQIKIEAIINAERKKQAPNPSFDLSYDLTLKAKTLLRLLRVKDTEKFLPALEAFKASFGRFKTQIGTTQITKSDLPEILKKAKQFEDYCEQFYYDATVPKEYALYGKFYYYHNISTISAVNKYSNGFVNLLNKALNKVNAQSILLFEEPHYYRVIYPQKLDKEEFISSTDDLIAELPEKMKDREIKTSDHKIFVDKEDMAFQLYDYKLEDGDVVSVNYNGDWIKEKYSLETKALTLKVKVNKSGKNYLLLHADDVGRNPPNTMAISYNYKGEKQKIVLSSDLNVSQLIEIEFQE